MAPTRWQAIIWTKDGKFTYAYMRQWVKKDEIQGKFDGIKVSLESYKYNSEARYEAIIKCSLVTDL